MQGLKNISKRKGQALLLVVVALSVFLLGGVGLAIDVSQMYSQRQLAQNAADAAALAAIMSIFNATNTLNGTIDNTFGKIVTAGTNPARLTCGSNDLHTPCYYARQNGFDPASGDTIFTDFWAQANAFLKEPGVSISNNSKDPVPLLRVTITRPVPSTLMRILGGGNQNVSAQATAAICTSVAPIPILVLHPTATGSLNTSGTGTVAKVTICGGPKRSIQVNSCAGTGGSIAKPNGLGSAKCASSNAFTWNGNPILDLSKAGPLDSGGCATGTGGDFGVFGLPAGPVGSPSPLNLGSAGHYLQPQSVIADPLINIPAPDSTGMPVDPPACAEAAGASTCPDSSGRPVTCPTADPSGAAVSDCKVLKPGKYTAAGSFLKDIKKDYLIFTPGIYYIDGGGVHFNSQSSGQTQNFPTTQGVYPTCTNADAKTGCGVLLYFSPTGGVFSVNSNASNIFLLGADPAGTYQAMIIYVDHTAPTQSHDLSGGGTWNVTGTIYATNTVTRTLNSIAAGSNLPGTFQSFTFGGNSASGTVNGEIIVDALGLSGTPAIKMNLDPATQQIRQISLVR